MRDADIEMIEAQETGDRMARLQKAGTCEHDALFEALGIRVCNECGMTWKRGERITTGGRN